MRVPALLTSIIACCALHGCARSQLSNDHAHGIQYSNGQWFDGTAFRKQTWYVVDGLLRQHAPSQIDSVVDLAGGFVVPPFGDAHVHFYDPTTAGAFAAAHLRDGVFYVKDQSNAPVGRQMYHATLNKPGTLDYISSNQGWTSPGGHPAEVLQRAAAMPGPMQAFIRDSLDPGLVMQVETTADIDKRWPYFLAGKPAPDFVKVFLQNSEAHASLRSDPRGFGNRGIDPALLPYLVARARAAGLHVSAHVFTAADFRAAIDAGITHLAHLPGGPGTTTPYLLNDADAQRAAARGVVVATTVSKDFEGDNDKTDRLVQTVYAPNIALLRKHAVRIVLGSDLIRGTSAVEAAALSRTHTFTNLELLRMWSEETPRYIFPSRHIGRFADGYEASFLVLAGDPLADFGATRKISMRIKQGMPVRVTGR